MAKRAAAIRPGQVWRYNGRTVQVDGWPLVVWRRHVDGRRVCLGGDVHLHQVGPREWNKPRHAAPAPLEHFVRYARRCA